MSDEHESKRQKTDQEFAVAPYLKDPTSYANIAAARVTGFHLALSVDFLTQVLTGHIDLDVLTVERGADVVILDTHHLKIKSVTLISNGAPLRYNLGEEHPVFGRMMDISLPPQSLKEGSVTRIRVEYSTSPQATSIQWLPPMQTAGKVHPYLFTQCQAIHARSLYPCQDTPSNKTAYTASINVPTPLVALMSALATGNEPAENGRRVYHFHQPIPIPSYLLAIAVGALERVEIGPRSAVWSEKEMVQKGVYEFAQTESFLAAAEEICGPYVWGRYDILLLPPSFPYGGMENPCLTFVTPTLLAGDRSLANVVAHEIAHSWMGNLVTSQTWEHFWMNEGFTVFLERKIVQAIYGKEYSHLQALIGWGALENSVEHYGCDHPHTRMWVTLDGVDPDDAFSSVPYEKGFNFLVYLENLVGGEEVMNPFLRAHCEKFKFSCVSSAPWREFFLEYFKDRVDAQKLASIDWDAWFRGTGMPPKPVLDATLSTAAETLASAIIVSHGDPKSLIDISQWRSSQVQVFLEALQRHQQQLLKDNNDALKEFTNTLRHVDKAYHFTDAGNSEIRFRWLTLCVRAEMEETFQSACAFLTEQGRMKFIRPLYRDLFKSQKGSKLAVDTFKANVGLYHSIAQKMVAKDLQLSE